MPYGVEDFGQHWFRYGLLPYGTKPWPDPVLSCYPQDKNRLLFQKVFQGGHIYASTQGVDSQVVFEICTFEITATSPREQCVIPAESAEKYYQELYMVCTVGIIKLHCNIVVESDIIW